MSISKLVENLLRDEGSVDQGVKPVTIRISYQKYAELCALSKNLGQSPSGLLKLLSETAIDECLDSYMSIIPADAADLHDQITNHVGSLLTQEFTSTGAIQ
jgi:hypothetical protein